MRVRLFHTIPEEGRTSSEVYARELTAALSALAPADLELVHVRPKGRFRRRLGGVAPAAKIGGYLDRLSGHPLRRKAYDCASCLNRGHMRWAWCSLFSVAFADIYVRLCSMGIWTDWRIL